MLLISLCFGAFNNFLNVKGDISSSKSALSSNRKFTPPIKTWPNLRTPPIEWANGFLPFLKEKRIKFSWAQLEPQPPTNARRLWVHLCSFVRVKPKSLSASRIRRLVYLHEQTNVRQIWCALSGSTFLDSQLLLTTVTSADGDLQFDSKLALMVRGVFIRPLTASVKRNTIIITISSHNATRRAGTVININLHPISMFFGWNRARSVDAS